MKLLLTAILLLQGLLTSSGPTLPIIPPGEEFQHSATHQIELSDVVDDAGCSATAVGPHTLLTAAHCFIPSHKIIIDGNDAKVIGIDYDDNDHLLVRVDETFAIFLPITQREFNTGEVVHMWGNPGSSKDVYRIGTFERTKDAIFNEFAMPVLPGDSGSGIFDTDGKLIGVVSVGNSSGETGVFSFDFTPVQIAAIQ